MDKNIIKINSIENIEKILKEKQLDNSPFSELILLEILKELKIISENIKYIQSNILDETYGDC